MQRLRHLPVYTFLKAAMGFGALSVLAKLVGLLKEVVIASLVGGAASLVGVFWAAASITSDQASATKISRLTAVSSRKSTLSANSATEPM